MDLEHVCVLHKKWFRNLRVIVQKPDYVEYRLVSLFYGLKQDILVRGAPIDKDHYWYEFLGPLARIRVEGLLEGVDGDLTQTEMIIYDFHWSLTPVFWLLRPLFYKQKEDILADDSRLLERVYKLDQAGFVRAAIKPRVIVYGGGGFFGRLMVEDLLKHSDVNIAIASRNPRAVGFSPFNSRITYVISDLNDYNSVLSTIEGAKAVVCCVGPYQGLTLNLLRGCIEKKVHYIDVADDRDFVERCHKLSGQIKEAGIMAFVGCSVVPGMSSLLTKFCLDKVRAIEKTRIFITPGTRNPRGEGSFLCLLSTVGEEFPIPAQGQNKLIKGWTGREKVNFPPPLGTRSVYFVVDIADYFLQRIYFNVQTVEFKIGSELGLLNRSLAGLRSFKEFLGIRNLRWFVPLSRMLIYLASFFGTTQGGVMVEVSGSDGEKVSMSVFAETRGEVIPSILPSVAVQMIVNEEIECSGIVPLPDWLSQDRFISELQKRQIKIAVKESDSLGWFICN